MRVVALEEHTLTHEIAQAWRRLPNSEKTGQEEVSTSGTIGERLLERGQGRLEAMKDQGVDVQVLSITSPGVQNLPADQAVPLASAANDAIAATVAANPDHYQGFATLPTPDPVAAATELRRAVTDCGLSGAMVFGRTGERNIDHPSFEPIWQAAADLRAPLYIHPQQPVAPVRQAYYSGFGDPVDLSLSGPAIGWHYETGMQLLRLILSGTFDRHPELQVIVGHWGEVVLFYIERVDNMLGSQVKLARPIRDYFSHNVYYTGSGDLTEQYRRWVIEVVGAHRLLTATDYPFIDNTGGQARRFLQHANLTTNERDGIASANWDSLTAHLR